jgi:hypothetical protein
MNLLEQPLLPTRQQTDEYQMHWLWLSFCKEEHERLFTKTLLQESYLTLRQCYIFCIFCASVPLVLFSSLIIEQAKQGLWRDIFDDWFANFMVIALMLGGLVCGPKIRHFHDCGSEIEKVIITAIVCVAGVLQFHRSWRVNVKALTSYIDAEIANEQNISSDARDFFEPYVHELVVLSVFGVSQLFWLMNEVVIMVLVRPKFAYAAVCGTIFFVTYFALLLEWQYHAVSGASFIKFAGSGGLVVSWYVATSVVLLVQSRHFELTKRWAWIKSMKLEQVETKLREEAIRNLEGGRLQAEELAKSESDLLAWVCHEIRNPFNVSVSFSLPLSRRACAPFFFSCFRLTQFIHRL